MATTSDSPPPVPSPLTRRVSPAKPRLRMATFSTPASPSRSWCSALLALSLAFWVHLHYQFTPLDTFWPSTQIDHDVEQHFTDTYLEARALFRQRTRAANAELHTLPLEHLKDMDLTIDIAVFRGASDKAVVHISGTHGVEGFAGSAIQSALLERLGNTSDVESPILIFVHALNPFGMAMLRRVNEHNVDLRRNFLTPEGFEERADRDPNTYGYVDLMEALNPPEPTAPFAWLHSWMTIVHHVFNHGFDSVKQAVETGNVRFPKSICYWGNEQEPSVLLLLRFFREHLNFDALQSVGMIDVHTGRGPAGCDTLTLDVAEDAAALLDVFEGRRPLATLDTKAELSSGYEASAGFLCRGIASLLPAHVSTVCLTQEFGTLAAPFVLHALIQENAMYHRAPSRRLPYAQQLRDAFYLHRSVQWKTDVVSRGVTVWEELEAHVYGDQ